MNRILVNPQIAKTKKVIFLTFTCALLLTLFLPIQNSVATPTTDTPTGVNGRILTANMAGDTSDWVEIAQNGVYSLIVRKNYVNWYPQASRYGNPAWQYTSFGATNSYANSNVRNIINNWFNGCASSAADNLPATARLRDYTMQNNALNVVGTCCNPSASLTNGFSKPTTTPAKTGKDVAFALSYGEAANFCSLTYFMRNLPVANQQSSTIAVANFNKITIPSGYIYGMWLRSPGDLSSTAGGMTNTYSPSVPGRVFQLQLSTESEHGLVYPALWVNSAIFETKGTINIIHKDATSGAVLSSATYSVNSGSYGPYNGLTFSDYDSGYLASNSAPASGTIAAGETKEIIYLYQRLYTVNVNNSCDPQTGSGQYTAGTTVTVSAGTRDSYDFSGWTVNTGGITLANTTITTFVMPANNVNVTANWKIAPN